MKSAISIPVISFLTLTSTVAAAPKSTAAASATGLSDEQWAAVKSYTNEQATKPAMISINKVLATAAVPKATLTKQQVDFRVAALATAKPKLPAYLKNTDDKAAEYLSSYYLAQASIINKIAEGKKAVDSEVTGAQILADVTGTAEPAAKTTVSDKSGKPISTVTKPSDSKESETTAATKGQDPALEAKSTSGATVPETTDKPEPTSGKGEDADSTSTGTASSSTSTGAAAMAYSTGAMKMAGVGMLGVAGVAAFL